MTLASLGTFYKQRIDYNEMKVAFKAWILLQLLGVCLAISDFHVGREIAAYSLDDHSDQLSEVEKALDRGSEGLQEFTPIRNTIKQTELQQYSFSVNTSTGLGAYYEFLIFITGNICDQPDDMLASGNQSLVVYYSFNASMFDNYELGTMVHFENGYFSALADVPISSGEDSILYIGVRAPESTNLTATWSYEIGVSQNDLVYQWDNRSFAQVVDTDDNLTLIVTGNLSSKADLKISDFNTSLSNFQLFIYSYEDADHFKYLNSSWCAVRNGPALLSTNNFNTSYTTRGGALRQQFFVGGLNASTKYVGFLVSDFSGSKLGGAVYSKFEFETMSSSACSLIYDLEFCDEVAYSVPALSLDHLAERSSLAGIFDDRAKNLYANFSKALQQIACNTTMDAIYSPIRTCTDCARLYKNWLCSVTIPRCSTRNITGYVERQPNESRNTFITDEIVPPQNYFEVLPCVNVCQAIVRDCPSNFGFHCPRKNESIRLSYFWDIGAEYATCNFLGVPHAVKSGASRASTILWMVPIIIHFLWFI